MSSTENLSIYQKTRIGLKYQFDLHKLLYISDENKTCTLRLVSLLTFVVKAEQIVILTIKEK